MHEREERKIKLAQFLSRFLRNGHVRPDEDIFAAGFVNSLLAVQLVSFIEKEFHIAIEDEDLEVDNFRSIDNIEVLIERKRPAAERENGRA